MLKRKHVLLLAPSFYNYEKEIILKIEELGGYVTFLNDDPSEFFIAIMEILKKIGIRTQWMVKSFENGIEKNIYNQKFDYIIVICGWAVTSRLTYVLRKKHLNKDGKMILYYWDSLERLNDDQARWRDFDSIFTFDLKDYKTHHRIFKFLPLFYCDKYWTYKEDKTVYDAMVVGSFRRDRLDFIRNLRHSNHDLRIDSYLYVTKWVYFFHKIFRKKYKDVKKSEVKFKKLSFKEVSDLYLSSNAVIDIPAKGQTGLTIRTFETLAMHTKLLTSNESVREYDFYNPDDIFIMKENDLELPKKDWFDKKFSIKDEIIKKYSITEWLIHILK